VAPEAELLSAPPAPAGVVVAPEAQAPAMGQLASDDGDVLGVLGVVVSPPPIDGPSGLPLLFLMYSKPDTAPARSDPAPSVFIAIAFRKLCRNDRHEHDVVNGVTKACHLAKTVDTYEKRHD